MIRDHAETLQAQFGWDSYAIYYPAGTGDCQLCDEPDRPLVGAYPDVAHPPEPTHVCLDCLSEHSESWALFGETILEDVEPGRQHAEPGFRADVDFELPDEWSGVPAPTYEPWDELFVIFDCEQTEVPASRSPFETKTVPKMDIEGPKAIMVNGSEYEYTDYAPVNVGGWEETESERLREPTPRWEEY